jgi:hypothetical protein
MKRAATTMLVYLIVEVVSSSLIAVTILVWR